MNRTLAAAAFLSGFFAVAIGAFGAHGLKPLMDEHTQSVFDTATRYHFYHALALLGLAALPFSKWQRLAGTCFIIGIVLFSGSLYLLALKDVLHIAHWKFLGPVTPLGGLFFLAGWGLGLIAILKK
jgi:uncharacterized membrane protein YgdD (TMEM256/DUF423 family)